MTFVTLEAQLAKAEQDRNLIPRNAADTEVAVLLEATIRVVRGESVSDFMESFPVVREAVELHARAEAAEAQCAALQAATLAFVNQLDHVLASPDYQSVLAMGWIHGAKEYRGPNWKAEYDTLRALLTATPLGDELDLERRA